MTTSTLLASSRRANVVSIAAAAGRYLSSSASSGAAGAPVLGTVWRWGSKTPGLGSSGGWFSGFFSRNNELPAVKEPDSPTIIPGFENVSLNDVACGFDHAAIVVEGELYTFGSNKKGQLGRPALDADAEYTPGRVELPGPVISVSCGEQHTAAVLENGAVYTWGYSGGGWRGPGALGQGSNRCKGEICDKPQEVTDFPEPALKVACGAKHTIALTRSGRVFSTGSGDLGRLGTGISTEQLEFRELDTLCSFPFPVKIVDVDTGAAHSVVLLDSGKVIVWGGNDSGQLGLDDNMGDMFSHEAYPREVAALGNLGIGDLSCGESSTVCATKTGQVFFFGARLWLAPREIRLPEELRDTKIPSTGSQVYSFDFTVSQSAKEKVVKVAVGGRDPFFAFAITNTGRVISWGKTKTPCLLRDTAKLPATEMHFVDPMQFNNAPVEAIVCGRNRALAITRTEAPKAKAKRTKSSKTKT